MWQNVRPVVVLRGIAGAVAGAVVGYYAFGWIVSQGFYAMMLPGLLVGLGCGWAARQRCVVNGVIAAVIGLAVSLYCEWANFPFVADDSLPYFLMHVHELKPLALLMIAVGVVLAYVFGVGRGSAESADPAQQ